MFLLQIPFFKDFPYGTAVYAPAPASASRSDTAFAFARGIGYRNASFPASSISTESNPAPAQDFL